MEVISLNLSGRTYSILKKHNIDTVEKLLKYKESELLVLNGMGNTIYNEIKEVVHSFNYKFDFEKRIQLQEDLDILFQSIHYLKRNKIVKFSDNFFKALVGSRINNLNELFTCNDYDKLCKFDYYLNEYKLLAEVTNLFAEFGFEFKYYFREEEIKNKKLKLEDITILNIHFPYWLKRNLSKLNIFKITDLLKYSESQIRSILKNKGADIVINEIHYLGLEFSSVDYVEKNDLYEIEKIMAERKRLIDQNILILKEIKGIIESQKRLIELSELYEKNNRLIEKYNYSIIEISKIKNLQK